MLYDPGDKISIDIQQALLETAQFRYLVMVPGSDPAIDTAASFMPMKIASIIQLCVGNS